MGCGSTQQNHIREPDSNSQKNNVITTKPQEAPEPAKPTPSINKCNETIAPTPNLQTNNQPSTKSFEVKKPNESATKLMNEGWILFNQKKIPEAFANMIKATEADPDCYEPWYNAGILSKFHVKESNIKSLELLKKAVSLNPEHKDALYYLGCCLNEEKRYKEAVEYFKKAAKLDPENINVFANLGFSCWEIQNFAECAYYLNIAAELTEKKNEQMNHFIIAGLALSYLSDSNKNYQQAAFWCNKYMNYPNFNKDQQETLKNYLALSYFMLKEDDKWIPLGHSLFETSGKHDFIKIWADRLSQYYLDNLDATKARIYCNVLEEGSRVIDILKSRRHIFKYSTHCKRYIKEHWSHIKEGKVIFALPMDLESQKLISFSTDFPKYRLIKEPPYNEVEFDFSDAFPELLKCTVVVEVKVIHVQHDPNKDLEKVTDPNDPLYEDATFSDSRFDWTNPDFMKKCEEIAKQGKTLYEKAKLFMKYNAEHYLHNNKNKEYDKEVSPGVFVHDYSKEPESLHISDTLKNMKGSCSHCAEMYVGMIRTLGVPCRIVTGCTAALENKGTGSIHFANEVYDASVKKWFYVEPQGGACFGMNNNWHVLIGDYMTQKKYPTNSCTFSGMIFTDAEYWGNKEALTYESQTISKC